jgi:DNA-binding NtrC family response regulator/glycine cleavage system H lipoate-binding protein
MSTANTAPRLLVVDDEQVVCESCTRILEGQGYSVDTSVKPLEGLRLAASRPYAAVLLDLRIPEMDGLKFLDELRKTHPNLPVIIITGYASVPTAAAAMRMGASDYLSKPFTPDEITEAVRKLVPAAAAAAEASLALAAPAPASTPTRATEAWSAASADIDFFDESWLQVGKDGTARVGTFLQREEARTLRSVKLLAPGTVVHRGLPLATVRCGDQPERAIPSPATGVVLEVNSGLAGAGPQIWEDPCGLAWIARLRPTRLDEDRAACAKRRVLVVGKNELAIARLRGRLVRLGCAVTAAAAGPELAEHLRTERPAVAIVDAASLGEEGPGLVRSLSSAAPDTRVVVVGDLEGRWEAAHRRNRIFYYTTAPSDDGEIVDLLAAAYRPAARPAAEAALSLGMPRWVRRIEITNRHGEHVALIASRGLMLERSGLGQKLIRQVLDGNYPVLVTVGFDWVTPLQVRRETETLDRVLVLEASDLGLVPGMLVHGAASELLEAAGAEAQAKASSIAIQPGASKDAPLAFDERTCLALAEEITREMTASPEARRAK